MKKVGVWLLGAALTISTLLAGCSVTSTTTGTKTNQPVVESAKGEQVEIVVQYHSD